MGGCCYTPRRTQFLWWYWLLLASIVGIPMLLACLYVARHQTADEEAQGRLGRIAASIFWAGSVLTAVLVVMLGYLLFGQGNGLLPLLLGGQAAYFSILLVGYLGGLIAFASIKDGDNLIRLLTAIAAYGVYLAIVFMPPSLTEFFWLPAICAGTAYFFTRFTAQPTARTARAALIAVVVGAFLFWGVMKYGRWVNFALYNAVRGNLSTVLNTDVDLGVY